MSQQGKKTLINHLSVAMSRLHQNSFYLILKIGNPIKMNKHFEQTLHTRKYKTDHEAFEQILNIVNSSE